MLTEIPTAVRICARCGELAEIDQSCESCRRIAKKASLLAAWAIDQGALGIQVEPCVTPADRLLAEMAAAEFHRLRAARLHGSLPSIYGMRPDVYEHGRPAARRLEGFVWGTLAVGAVWLLVWACLPYILDCLQLWFGWGE